MKGEIIEGIIQGNERGYGFLIPNDNLKEDYFIPHGDLRGAMHKDRVLCETTCGTGLRTTARVLKVLERGYKEIVGTFNAVRSGGFVVADEKKFSTDVYVPNGKTLRAKTGDKVVCKITLYPKRQNPEGIITEILGKQFNKTAELKSIVKTYNLCQDFPDDVIKETNNLKDEISKEEIKKRKDFRKDLTFTIDGDDSRDFDDAVSIKLNKKGQFVLGVHIADVSHYVKAFSKLDKEALNRATSVYFPESVIPMLPEKLSNDLCSLKQGSDRLTLSCVMTINDSGKVVDYYITPSVIRSKARLTYSKVQSILDGDEKLREEYSYLLNDLMLMDALADILASKRDLEGSIDLDVKDSQIIVKNGKIDVASANKDKAHKIIEEFMICANRTVSEYMYFLENPFIYRVHAVPSEDRLNTFYAFLSTLGINAKKHKGEIHSKDFQAVLKNAKDTPQYTLINRVMLRSMQKAKYSPQDIGHFGLSLKHYCHFTSPIRRYPDLAIHRIIKDFLNGQVDLQKRYGEFIKISAEQSSIKERNAEEAERAVDDFYKMLYIKDYVGYEFTGVISGVMPFGIFVELPNGIEGLVRIENLPSKKLRHDEKTMSLTDGKTTYKLGDTAKISVVGVDMGQRKAEFLLV